MSSAAVTVVTTPDGPFTIVSSNEAVLASGWTDDLDLLLAVVHPTLRPAREDLEMVTSGELDSRTSAPVSAVTAYYDGDLGAPGLVPVHQLSGDFRMLAWEVLRRVQPGQQLTYSEYAALTGRPAAVRAAAGACARNAAALFVPCHRIIRTDGTLGGFAYGLAVKQRLLDREGAPAAAITLF